MEGFEIRESFLIEDGIPVSIVGTCSNHCVNISANVKVHEEIRGQSESQHGGKYHLNHPLVSWVKGFRQTRLSVTMSEMSDKWLTVLIGKTQSCAHDALV